MVSARFQRGPLFPVCGTPFSPYLVFFSLFFYDRFSPQLVGGVRAAPAVDGLVLVANDKDSAAPLREETKHRVLDAVGILGGGRGLKTPLIDTAHAFANQPITAPPKQSARLQSPQRRETHTHTEASIRRQSHQPRRHQKGGVITRRHQKGGVITVITWNSSTCTCVHNPSYLRRTASFPSRSCRLTPRR